MPEPKIQYEKCSTLNASTTRHYGFNLTVDDMSSQQWRFIDSAPVESRGRFRGEVTVDRGDLFQASDIEVRVIIASNDNADLENVVFHSTKSALDLEYAVTDKSHVCTDVQVLIYLRPWPKRLLHVLEIRSEILHIALKDKLDWHIDNLVVHTSHGDSTYDASHRIDPLVVQNVSVSSISGYIFGKYVANGNLKLQNEHGQIGCFLLPLYGRPFKPESISVSTVSGNIHVETAWGYPHWPAQPYTHVTNIHSIDGEVWTYIPHGSVTNISSIGSILATRLQPFGTAAPTDQSEFYTYSGDSGADNIILIDDANPDSLKGRYNPLSNTISRHFHGSGMLRLRYPYSWLGNMEAQIEEGSLDFDSSALEDLERGEGYVKARRGKTGESQLGVQVGVGELSIKLGL